MRRRGIVRIQLVALGLLLLFLLIRVFDGEPRPDGIVVFDEGWDVGELRHRAFEIDRPVSVSVQATGSFSNGPELAAYGWIIRRNDRKLVWTMSPEEARREDRSLARQTDSLLLPPGLYDVYFTTHGNPLQGEERTDASVLERLATLLSESADRWKLDADEWFLQLRAVDAKEAEFVRPLYGDEADDFSWPGIGLIWESGPVRSGEQRERFFEVSRPMRVRVYAVGELLRSASDYGYIEDLTTGRTLWSMNTENTLPAGGAERNRLADEVILLPPGLYRAGYRTDRSHGYQDWQANPPYDPAGWGLRLTAADPTDAAYIGVLDPWKSLPRLAELTRVGDDEEVNVEFVVERPMRVLVYAVGEGTHEMHDYAWIFDNRANQRIWEMKYEETAPAGGADKNRLAETFLELAPGTYTLYYRTDDSHSFEDFNAPEPAYPERWGATIFALDPSAPVHPAVPPHPGMPVPPEAPLPPPAPGTLVQLNRIGSDKHLEHAFELGEETTLHIYAVGELMPRERLDYGWIVDAATGRNVWEMTRSNTEHAGGSHKNRKFDGVVTLPAGRYVAHFKTDPHHAFNDFGPQAPPDDPAGWGLLIRRAGE